MRTSRGFELVARIDGKILNICMTVSAEFTSFIEKLKRAVHPGTGHEGADE
jgi:hypothetical protein